MRIDPGRFRLYLVSDRRFCPLPLEEQVRQAVAGGVSAVQLREKDADARSILETGARLLAFLRPAGVPLILNDRADLAAVLDADGVHLGRRDLPVAEARRILGSDKWIGATVSSVEEAQAAEAAGADYLGAGALFATSTKSDHSPVIGFEGLKRVAEAVCIPVVAIGGVTAESARRAVLAGACGVAVVSAILSAPSIAQAARGLREEVEKALRCRAMVEAG